MATVTDLYDVPSAVPELAHLDGMYLSAAFAVYNVVPIAGAELDALMSALNTPINGFRDGIEDENEEKPAAAMARRPDFAEKSLRDVIEHHKTTAIDPDTNTMDSTYHPLSFIAITQADWRTHGVLLVSLNFNGNGDVFVFPHPALNAAATLIDIEVGNNLWEEAADTIGAVIPDIPSTTGDVALPAQWSEDTMRWFAFYLLPDVETGPIWEALNGGPACWTRPGGIRSCPCQPADWQYLMRLNRIPGLDGQTAAAVSGHTTHVHDLFHKRIFVIVDHENVRSEGVLVAEIGKDTETGEGAEGAGPGNSEDVQLERIPVADLMTVLVSKAMQEGLVADTKSKLSITGQLESE